MPPEATPNSGVLSPNWPKSSSARRTVAVQVYPDHAIEVEVPIDTDYAVIEAFVKWSGVWILRQLRELARYDKPANPLPRQYVSGESRIVPRYSLSQVIPELEPLFTRSAALLFHTVLVQTVPPFTVRETIRRIDECLKLFVGNRIFRDTERE